MIYIITETDELFVQGMDMSLLQPILDLNAGYYSVIDNVIDPNTAQYVDGAIISTNDPAYMQDPTTMLWKATPVTTQVNAARSAAYDRIESAAEGYRSSFLTPGTTMLEVYNAKSTEADNYILAGYPVDTTLYPYIALEVLATGNTTTVAADTIQLNSQLFQAACISVELIRRQSKIALTAASTLVDVDAILTTALGDIAAL